MIRFSKREDYAVIIISELAKNYNKRLVPLSEIAKRYKISVLFLRNLANELKNAGIITAVEGKSGGYLLQGDPSILKVGDVLQVFSKKPLLECCPIGKLHKGACKKVSSCETGYVWRRLNKEFLDKIYKLSLLEFVNYKYKD